MKKWRIVMAMFILLILIAGMIFGISLLWSFSSSEETPNSRIAFSCHGSISMQADLTVIDSIGHPVAGALVEIRNSSGTSEEKTDATGVVHIRPGEPEIEQIKVNGRTVLNRNLAYWYNFPRITEGFSATITLK